MKTLARILAENRKYYRKNRKAILAAQRRYKRLNRDKISARRKAHYKANRKNCAARDQKYYRKNRKRIIVRQDAYNKKNRKAALDYHREHKYGVTPARYRRMLEAQGGVCAICSAPGGKRSLGIDHDHDSGQIRELLCQKCNAAIGLLKDSSELVRKAATYLEKHGK